MFVHPGLIVLVVVLSVVMGWIAGAALEPIRARQQARVRDIERRRRELAERLSKQRTPEVDTHGDPDAVRKPRSWMSIGATEVFGNWD